MKGIRDLSQIENALQTLKSVLFVYGSSTFLCLELVKVIKKLSSYDTFDELKSVIKIEVLIGLRYLINQELDYYRCLGEIKVDDPAFDFISGKIDIVNREMNKIKIFL